MRNLLPAIMLVVLATLANVAPAAAQPVTMPPEMAPFVPTNLRAYFVGFFVNPPKKLEMTREVWESHQLYMRSQVEAGRYKAMGPLTDDGPIRGIMIIEAASIEEARALIAGDPAVEAGMLAIEVHPAILPDLSPVVVQYQPRAP